ncbi:ABC transporter ATP-binding protein [Rhizobium sp. BK376]|uniref:ABC transporter ATP-binding protein n=1 Tax=Rhizobium sp. BK376 TaxID=2512149 RepID=UPI001043DAE0|nr:ABC transporter ATP-binding protein [Rhizobium sp. BK376]
MERTANGLDCCSLVKSFTGAAAPVLKNVSLSIRENEFFTLLGPSGCGKTTLLRLIAGLEVQDSGTIDVAGVRVDAMPPFNRPVNTVFQSYAIFPHMTVAQNIAFGLEARRRPRTEIAAKVAQMLSLVRLDGMGNRRPRQLSGGQQQRVALARALANQPKLLLLDEPLSALDLKLRTEMQLELKRIQSELGITFIFVTHDQHEALAMSDRIAVMSNGQILQIGTPQQIYETPANRFVAEFIGETNLMDATRLSQGKFRLASGVVLDAEGSAQDAAIVTLAIRPEHAAITEPRNAGMRGIVRDVAYLGADRLYYVELDGGLIFRIRETNHDWGAQTASKGARVGVALRPRSVRVLS